LQELKTVFVKISGQNSSVLKTKLALQKKKLKTKQTRKKEKTTLVEVFVLVLSIAENRFFFRSPYH